MNTANLELCKELYEISGWDGTSFKHECLNDGSFITTLYDGSMQVYKENLYYPAYDLGYLLQRLPKSVTEFWGRAYSASPCLMFSGTQWVIFYQSEMTGEHNTDELFGQFADTPEDAACMLAIELFKQDVLK